MKVKTSILFIMLAISSFATNAEGQDTLAVNPEFVQKRQADSLKALLLFRAAGSYAEKNMPDSALQNINRSLEIADLLNLRAIEAANYELAGSVYEKLSGWEDELLNYLRASSIYSTIKDKEKEAAIFRKIASKYFNLGIYNKSAFYSEQEFSLYSGKSTALMATSSESAALSWFYLPDDTMAVRWFLAASNYYAKEGDNPGTIRCSQKLAMLYTRLGQYGQADLRYRQLLKDYSGKNDFTNAALIYNNLGVLKFKQKDYENSLTDFTSAVNYSQKEGKNDFFLTDVYSNIAIAYQNLNRQKEMLSSFTTALEFAKNSSRKDEEARLEHILAIIFFKKGDNYHADLYCRDCIEASKESSSSEIMKDCYFTWSEVMKKGNDFEKALEYFERYLTISDSLRFENRVAEKEEADRKAGYDALEQRIKLDIRDKEISGLAMKNLKAESARKENELRLLQKQQELDRSEKNRLEQSLILEQEKRLAAENRQKMKQLEQEKINKQLELDLKSQQGLALQNANKLLETENRQQELKIESEKKIKRLFVGIGVLMVLVAAMILTGLISTRRKNQKLAESKRQIEKINSDLEDKNREVLKQNEKIIQQKDIIEQKNQSITDSIQYASRIQTAVLPPLSFLSDWEIDNFIFYRPKDIVSGDFYWGMKKKNRIIVAAADCTGHGVPGAFMSMLGHAFLDEIVNTTEVDDAASILNLLRDEVINTLKQKGMVGETRDGMDISLCIIDREAGKLDFAGANNPLYMVRDAKMTKIQADRMPIGIHFTDLSPFTNNSIEIRKGDYIYIFSDGFADQFGGPKGKKYMYRPFQELLLRNHSKPMEMQKEILDNTFIKWKGEREQVDDVLIIGMKL